MSAPQFTPGPWHVAADTLIRDSDGRAVGTARLRVSGCEEQEANARLIAAAPELYAVAVEVAKRPCEMVRNGHCTMIPCERECLPCAARSALAKARGEGVPH